MTIIAGRIMDRAAVVLVSATLVAMAAAYFSDKNAGLILAAVSGVLLSCLIISLFLTRLHSLIRSRAMWYLQDTLSGATTQVMVTDDRGHRWQPSDPMAKDAFEGTNKSGPVHDTVAMHDLGLDQLAMDRLLETVLAAGQATENNDQGQITVRSLTLNRLLWVFSRHQPTIGGHSSNITARLPMFRVGKTGTILFLNPAATELLGQRPKSLDAVFTTGPPAPGTVTEVSTKHGMRNFLVIEYDGAAGCRDMYLLPAPDNRPQQTNGPRSVSFDGLPVPLLKVAPDGTVKEANTMARQLIHHEVTPHTVMSDLMEGLGRSISDWLSEAAAGRGLHHSEFLRLKRTDREKFVQVTLTRLQENTHVSLIAVLNDATELKTLEAQFVQSQKMQAIGQLAGGVAHDFNNLLTAISGHCDLLLLRHDQGDPDYGDLVQINQNANRAAALVGQLLAFSRKQTLRPEVVDLRDTLSELTHLLNRLVGEKVSLSLSHDPTLGTIRADKRQLEQVLMNLVVNARDAMADGGEILIRTEGVHLDSPLTRDRAVVPPGDYVCVTVSDSGCGIAPDKLQKVFEPFFTTKRTGEGTGLGLSTAYGIVKQSGGYIFIDSILGQGTRFTLFFPVFDDIARHHKPAAIADNTMVDGHKGGVVLLVEDEAPVRAFASRALRLRGFTVLEADSGEAALKTLEDDSLNIDLFVTDVVMPGLDGPSWVRQARQKRPDVKVVFVSGYAEDSFADQQARITGSVFLPKPFSLADLTTTVQAQII